jgi:hypothetical protein
MEEDVTQGIAPNDKILTHDAPMEGIQEEHRYDIKVDGSIRQDGSVEQIIRELVGTDNGNQS